MPHKRNDAYQNISKVIYHLEPWRHFLHKHAHFHKAAAMVSSSEQRDSLGPSPIILGSLFQGERQHPGLSSVTYHELELDAHIQESTPHATMHRLNVKPYSVQNRILATALLCSCFLFHNMTAHNASISYRDYFTFLISMMIMAPTNTQVAAIGKRTL